MQSVFNPMNLIVTESADTTGLISYTEAGGSYFNETLSFLSECAADEMSIKKTFYRSLLESQGNEVLVHESFSDFFAGIKKIIEKIINFLKSLFDRFITKLHAFFKSEKYLKKHKEDFRKFTNKHEFKYSGYEFTFQSNIPSTSVLRTFADSMVQMDLNEIVNSSDEIGNKKGLEKTNSVNAELKKRYDKTLEDAGDRMYDEIRAIVIGKEASDYVLQSEFANELFTLFRHDQSSKEEIDVTSSVVAECYDRFDNNTKATNEVKKDKDRVEKEYANIKKSIETAMKRTSDGTKVSVDIDLGNSNSTGPVDFVNKDTISLLDLFIKAKSNQIQEISNIHALAFSAKLDALSDCFKQDKDILYKALSKIQGTIKED